MKQFQKCPKCNDIHGWCTKSRGKILTHYSPNGDIARRYVEGEHGAKLKYCVHCGASVTQLIRE